MYSESCFSIRYKKIQDLVVHCRRSSEIGEAVDIGGAIFRTMLNLLSNTLFRRDLADPYEDSGKEFKELVEGMMMDMGKPNLVDYFPVLKIADPQGVRRYNSSLRKLLNLFNGFINERLELRKSKNYQDTDVLDALITASEHNPQEINHKHIAILCLVRSLIILLFYFLLIGHSKSESHDPKILTKYEKMMNRNLVTHKVKLKFNKI